MLQRQYKTLVGPILLPIIQGFSVGALSVVEVTCGPVLRVGHHSLTRRKEDSSHKAGSYTSGGCETLVAMCPLSSDCLRLYRFEAVGSPDCL